MELQTDNRKKIFLYSGLLIAGLLLAFLILKNLVGEFAPYTWKKTPCTIRKAEIVKPEPESQHYNFFVTYDYSFEESRFSNTVWRARTDLEPYDSYSALTDETGKYMLDPNSFCYVNPDEPSQAVLQRENPVRILLLVIPAMAIVPATLGLLRMRMPSLRSQKSRSAMVRVLLQTVAFAVIAFGLFLFAIFFVQGIYNVIRATTWKPSTCTVIDSYLYTDRTSSTSGSSDKRPGYRIRVLFSYIHEGKEFRADRYDFVRWGTGGQKQAKILEQFPAEARVPCYINTTKPYEAVLNRSLSLRYFMGLLLLLIAAAGFLLFWAARRSSAQ